MDERLYIESTESVLVPENRSENKEIVRDIKEVSRSSLELFQEDTETETETIVSADNGIYYENVNNHLTNIELCLIVIILALGTLIGLSVANTIWRHTGC